MTLSANRRNGGLKLLRTAAHLFKANNALKSFEAVAPPETPLPSPLFVPAMLNNGYTQMALSGTLDAGYSNTGQLLK